MKIFLFTLALFTLLLSFITFNYIYVNKSAEALAQNAARISPSTDEINRLTALWESKKPIIVLSSGMSKIDNIYDLLDALCVYAEFGDLVEFERCRALLVNAFDDLAEFESFSFQDIF